jgi:hypothetical protein
VIRLTALRTYRREYFHALRNGKSSEEAAAQAFDRVRSAFLQDPSVRPLDGVDRAEKWGEVIGPLVEFQILLKDVPIDTSQIPPKDQIDSAESVVGEEEC